MGPTRPWAGRLSCGYPAIRDIICAGEGDAGGWGGSGCPEPIHTSSRVSYPLRDRGSVWMRPGQGGIMMVVHFEWVWVQHSEKA